MTPLSSERASLYKRGEVKKQREVLTPRCLRQPCVGQAGASCPRGRRSPVLPPRALGVWMGSGQAQAQALWRGDAGS